VRDSARDPVIQGSAQFFASAYWMARNSGLPELRNK
jgi:hypothetical protein